MPNLLFCFGAFWVKKYFLINIVKSFLIFKENMHIQNFRSTKLYIPYGLRQRNKERERGRGYVEVALLPLF